MILLSEMTRAQDAAVSAEKILLAVRTPHRIDQYDLHVTASIGIATYPDDGTDAETLMKSADFAMYHAKDSSRNNYQFFKPDMNKRAVERQSSKGICALPWRSGNFSCTTSRKCAWRRARSWASKR